MYEPRCRAWYDLRKVCYVCKGALPEALGEGNLLRIYDYLLDC